MNWFIIMQGAWTNTSFHNKFENFTIDVGKGNPGAIGIEFNSNNTGAMRNVDILSSDPEYAGFAGLVDRSKPSVLRILPSMDLIMLLNCQIAGHSRYLNT